jgi:hypothetical protein
MNCPHCQKELPENYGANWCSFCGKDLATDKIFPKDKSGIQRLPTKGFFISLLAPAIVSFTALLLHVEFIAAFAGIFGILVSGFVCAILYVRSLNPTGFKRAFLNLFFIAAFCFLSFALSGLGCVAGAAVSSTRVYP